MPRHRRPQRRLRRPSPRPHSRPLLRSAGKGAPRGRPFSDRHPRTMHEDEDVHEDLDSRRLSRHAAYAFPASRKLAGHEVEIWNDHVQDVDVLAERLQGHRSAGADTRAHADPRAARRAPRASSSSSASAACIRTSTSTRARARGDRVVVSASGHAVVRRRRTDLGPDPGRHAADSAADGRAAERTLANRRGRQPARQDAGDLRLRQDRRRRGGLRQGVRNERSRLGARGVARAGAQRRLRDGAQQARVFRGVRRSLAAPAPGRGDPGDRHGRRPGRDEAERAYS